jgi:hypothetical protein
MTNYMQVDDGGGRQQNIPVDPPSNSHKSKAGKAPPAAPRKADKVITGEVTVVPPSLWKKARSSLVSGDVGKSVWQFVVMDVLIPAARNLVVDTVSMMGDAVSEGVRQAMFGETRAQAAPGRRFYTNYNRVRQSSPVPEYGTITSRARSQHDFDQVILGHRGDAEVVLDKLRELIEQYGVATVEDYYDALGISGDFTDLKWGWTDLRPSRATVRSVPGGYIVALPQPRPLD